MSFEQEGQTAQVSVAIASNSQRHLAEPPAFLYSDVLAEPPAQNEDQYEPDQEEDRGEQAVHQQDQEAFMMIKDHTAKASPLDEKVKNHLR